MDYISGWCKSGRRLEGQTVIVTGANSGIGKETALDLYKRGARVIMGCRNLEKAEAAKQEIIKYVGDNNNGTLVIEPLDLSNLKSVQEFCSRVLKKEPQINILINNAGVMMCQEGRTIDGFETHIGINHFGHALLTLLLLPRIIQSVPARIVNVSSLGNLLYDLDLEDLNVEKTYGPAKAYCASKCANILFTRALDLKLKENNINNVTTYSLHPGAIITELGRHLDETVFLGATWILKNIIYWFLKSPRCGAQTTIYCAVDEACAGESGYHYSDCGKSWMVTRQCRNQAVALKFWDLTLEKLNMQDYNPFVVMDKEKIH